MGQCFLHTAISIHAPREGSDSSLQKAGAGSANFYPRSPRGERLSAKPEIYLKSGISIHAPREGSDVLVTILYHRVYIFLSTLPARGATNSL